jgi:UDP-N-acetylmuramate--alanine ligase
MQTIQHLNDINRVFFIGVAGTGMSALAQFLAGKGKQVHGSDRYFLPDHLSDIQQKLEAAGIACHPQDGSGLSTDTDLVVVSTAIEETVQEVQLARSMQIPIMRRSELLAMIADQQKTIAVAGTSGKSTTSAMLFDILHHAGKDPGIISGAGLVRLIRQGKIGNAAVGSGEWLIIEADESDGSIVQYHPSIGLLLNIDKDHQSIDELMQLFKTFQQHTRDRFIVNRIYDRSASLSVDGAVDFGNDPSQHAGYNVDQFRQEGVCIYFSINGVSFQLNTPGWHNMENALAAAATAASIGIPLEVSAAALQHYEGIHRRHQVLGVHKGITVVDDYAHNPAKCAASIQACQPLAQKVVAWFQPHGYGPTRFLKDDFIQSFSEVLRPQDELWMSEIYFAGGTAIKDISAKDLIDGIAQNGRQAFFESDRIDFVERVKSHLSEDTVLLLMGARDPGLESFGQYVWENIQQL